VVVDVITTVVGVKTVVSEVDTTVTVGRVLTDVVVVVWVNVNVGLSVVVVAIAVTVTVGTVTVVTLQVLIFVVVTRFVTVVV
jgi:hypothetical protein